MEVPALPEQMDADGRILGQWHTHQYGVMTGSRREIYYLGSCSVGMEGVVVVQVSSSISLVLATC